MKKYKRVLALVGVVIILAAFCLPMVFAGGSGEGSKGMFLAALGVAFMVPVFLYLFLMVCRVFGNRKKAPEGKVKNIIFDVGNVLVKYDWQGYLKSFGFPEEKYNRIARATFCNESWNERDKGLLSEEEYEAMFIANAPEYAEDIREVMRRSPECIHPQPYAKTWVQYLKNQGYGIYILSNYSTYMLEHNRPDMKFLEFADGEIFSCNVGEIKPHAAIYRLLLERFSLDPSQCVFLDDRVENCEAARKQGIKAIVFEDFKQAAEDLKKLGVK
ncbi:MAG: HAD family phosphatase [Blautia sp.]|nr:HAD family phosphatase [Blautia sp.]